MFVSFELASLVEPASVLTMLLLLFLWVIPDDPVLFMLPLFSISYTLQKYGTLYRYESELPSHKITGPSRLTNKSIAYSTAVNYIPFFCKLASASLQNYLTSADRDMALYEQSRLLQIWELFAGERKSKANVRRYNKLQKGRRAWVFLFFSDRGYCFRPRAM